MSSKRVAYVIGGGPSLKGFDFSKLAGYKIGANKSALVANCDCLVSMDGQYARECYDELLGYPGEIILGLVRPEYENNKLPNATYVKSIRQRGLSKDPTVLYGLNSGYSAVDVAYKKGFTQINLLGFDMKMGETKHFHDGYHWANGAGNYSSWVGYFDDIKSVFTKEGITCINYVGPEGSALTQFETRPLSELDEHYNWHPTFRDYADI